MVDKINFKMETNMYVNSKTISSIMKSLCYIFNVTDEKLFKILLDIEKNSNSETKDDVIDKFIKDNMLYKPNEVLLFHLSRRLNSTLNDTEGLPLSTLLTTNNTFSTFLKKYGLNFKLKDKYIEIIYNGEIKSLDDDNNPNILYLRRRLGYNKTDQDFCFNGFILNPLIGQNIYISSLEDAPEIIINLSEFINNNLLLQDYKINSAYYCFEYKVPIDKIIFDGKEELNNDEKVIYLLRSYITILIDYYIYNNHNIETCIIIRLADNYKLASNYFVSKFMIDKA